MDRTERKQQYGTMNLLTKKTLGAAGIFIVIIVFAAFATKYTLRRGGEQPLSPATTTYNMNTGGSYPAAKSTAAKNQILPSPPGATVFSSPSSPRSKLQPFDVNSLFESVRGAEAPPKTTGPIAAPASDGSAGPIPPGDQNKTAGDAESVALHAYGNALGAPIKAIAPAIQLSPAIFQKIIATTTPPNSNDFDSLASLAEDYRKTGAALLEVSENASAPNFGNVLGADYRAVGDKILALVATGRNGGTISVDIWRSYSDSVVALGRKYLAVINFFEAKGVSFSREETGSVFSFREL